MDEIYRNTPDLLKKAMPKLEAILSSRDCRLVEKGEILKERGHVGSQFFFLKSGLVMMKAGAVPMFDNHIFFIHGDYEWFGLEVLTSKLFGPTSHYVTMTDCEICFFENEEFLAFDKKLIHLIYMQYVDYYFDSVFERAVQHTYTLEHRVINALLVLNSKCLRLEIDINATDLAQYVGASRQAVTTILISLEDKGLIQRQRGSVSILDRAGLEKLSYG